MREDFEDGGFMAQKKGVLECGQQENVGRQRRGAQGGRRFCQILQGHERGRTISGGSRQKLKPKKDGK